MKQEVMTLIPWLVAIYAVICVAAYFGNRMFMYFPDPTRAVPVAVGLKGVKESRDRGCRWHRTDCLACAGEG